MHMCIYIYIYTHIYIYIWLLGSGASDEKVRGTASGGQPDALPLPERWSMEMDEVVGISDHSNSRCKKKSWAVGLECCNTS